MHSDLLYRVQLEGRPTLVFVLFEHQSTADPTMPLRLLRYMTRVWKRFAQDQPGQPLPPIVPTVLLSTRSRRAVATHVPEATPEDFLGLADDFIDLASLLANKRSSVASMTGVGSVCPLTCSKGR